MPSLNVLVKGGALAVEKLNSATALIQRHHGGSPWDLCLADRGRQDGAALQRNAGSGQETGCLSDGRALRADAFPGARPRGLPGLAVKPTGRESASSRCPR